MKNKGYQPATKAILMARVSTEEQADEDRFSIPAQIRKQREYAKSGGNFGTLKEIITEFQIEECAFQGKRTKFRQALEIIEKYDEPVAIIFDVVDRFTRRWKEVAEYDELRRDGKIELHFISQGLFIFRNSPAHVIQTWEMFVMMARAFSLSISGNVKRSIREKLARGIFPGGDIPTGYLPENGKIVLDPEWAPYLKKMTELYSTGKYSLPQLTKIMQKAGFTTKTKRIKVNGKLVKRKPKLVTLGDVAAMLRNPFPTGKFLYKDPDTGERKLWDNRGSYPILFNWSLYQKVQKILNKNNSRSNGYKKNDFLFRGLITCGFCGYDFTPEEMSRTYSDKNSPQANEVYYHCTNGKAASDPDFYKKKFGSNHTGVYVSKKGKRKDETIYACPGHTKPWWKEKDIEEYLLKYMDKIVYGEEVFEWFRLAMEEDYSEQAEMLENQIKLAKIQYAKNKDLIKALVHSMATETDPELKADFRKEYNSLKSDQEHLKKEISVLEEGLEIDTDEIINKLQFCSNLRDQYELMDLEGKQQLLNTCFSDVIAWHGDLGPENDLNGLHEHDPIEFVWNEPFRTLEKINLDEFVFRSMDCLKGSSIVTKVKEMEASPDP